MRIAGWLRNTNKNVICIAFLQQQWLHERASMLHLRALPALLCVFAILYGCIWFVKTESKACLLRDLETNKMQDISLNWTGRVLKRKKNMWNNSIEIYKNKLKCACLDS